MTYKIIWLQHTATICTTRHHTTTHRTALRHSAILCNTLQHTATHCNTLQHTATQCNIMQHAATNCDILNHTAPHCTILQHTTTHCNTLHHTSTQVCVAPEQAEHILLAIGHAPPPLHPAGLLSLGSEKIHISTLSILVCVCCSECCSTPRCSMW